MTIEQKIIKTKVGILGTGQATRECLQGLPVDGL